VRTHVRCQRTAAPGTRLCGYHDVRRLPVAPQLVATRKPGPVLSVAPDSGCKWAPRCVTCPYDRCVLEEVSSSRRQRYVDVWMAAQNAP
jgi:hypothetical protein